MDDLDKARAGGGLGRLGGAGDAEGLAGGLVLLEAVEVSERDALLGEDVAGPLDAPAQQAAGGPVGAPPVHGAVGQELIGQQHLHAGGEAHGGALRVEGGR